MLPLDKTMPPQGSSSRGPSPRPTLSSTVGPRTTTRLIAPAGGDARTPLGVTAQEAAVESARRTRQVEIDVESSVQNINVAGVVEIQRAAELLNKTAHEQSAEMVEVKRQLQAQQAVIAELTRQQRRVDGESGVEALTAKLRAEMEALQEQKYAKYDIFLNEWEQHKADSAAAQAAILGMRDENAAIKDVLQLQQGQTDTLLHNLRGEVDTLREEAKRRSHSSDEVRALHMDIMQSTGDLAAGIEEVSNAVVATEQRLRQELEAARQEFQAADDQQREQIAGALRASLEAQPLAELAETLRRDLSQLEAAVADDHTTLRKLLEPLRAELSAVQANAADGQQVNARAASAAEEASRRCEEVAATAASRLGRLEEGLAELRGVEATWGNSLFTKQDAQEIWGELNVLKGTLHESTSLLKATLEARNSAAQAEADVRSLEVEVALEKRVELLEDELRSMAFFVQQAGTWPAQEEAAAANQAAAGFEAISPDKVAAYEGEVLARVAAYEGEVLAASQQMEARGNRASLHSVESGRASLDGSQHLLWTGKAANEVADLMAVAGQEALQPELIAKLPTPRAAMFQAAHE